MKLRKQHSNNNINNQRKQYLGTSETSFKEQFINHLRDFRSIKYIKNARLSKYVWSLTVGIIPTMKWRKVRKDFINTISNFFIIQSLCGINLLNK